MKGKETANSDECVIEREREGIYVMLKEKVRGNVCKTYKVCERKCTIVNVCVC